jgi:hypothetical protein
MNSKSEMKVAQLITESIDSNSTYANQKPLYRNLVLSKESKHQTLYESARIMFYILSTRGLFRTILMLTQPFQNNKDFFNLSRIAIINSVLIQYELFKKQFLTKLSFDFKSYDEVSLIPNFPANQLLSEYQIKLNSNYENLVFGKPFNKRYRFSNDTYGLEKYNLFIDRFISWNSIYFIIFIKRNRLEDLVKEFLLQHYPAVFDELEHTSILQSHDHLLSSINLDNVYQANGFNAYEVLINAEVLNQRFIKIGEDILNLDITSSVKQRFVAGNWQYIRRIYKGQELSIFSLPTNHSESISEGIYLIGRCDENWYHFLLDTLPRLLFFENVPASVPLLIRSDLPKTTKEFISKITNRNILELEPNTAVKISKLYVRPGRSTVFDVEPPNNVNWVEFSPIVLSKLKKKILDCFDTGSLTSNTDKIYISRKSGRRTVINAQHIEKIVHEYGFAKFDLSDKFFQIQARIFANSDCIISPGGAVLANIIFMKPGKRVIVLRSGRTTEPDIWTKLAEASNAEYFEVKGFPSYWGLGFSQRLHSNFYISSRKLRRMLSKEI